CMSDSANEVLRRLPAMTAVLERPAIRALIAARGRGPVLAWTRAALDDAREQVPSGRWNGSDADDLLRAVAEQVLDRAWRAELTRMAPVVNATGIVLHTGLGRAPLSQAAREALLDAAGATNVEVDLDTGERRYRGHQLHAALTMLTGAEDALVVNNNAAATLLVLQGLCAGREVVISRGQLIEIGGSFRLPEIFQLSGTRLREVGTTNRTRLADYERAIGPETAAVMLVHPSNYRVVGFAESCEIGELAALARERDLLAIDDIGSGALVDVTTLGLPGEPTFQKSLAAGADVVLGSGDKLLGGPQAGIILGRRDLIERLRNHPLARALRVDKLTLAALQATLDAYVRGTAETEVPTLAFLAATSDSLRTRAEAVREAVQKAIGPGGSLRIEVRDATAAVGGGALPAVELPTTVLAVRHADNSADEFSRRLRTGRIRVMGRVQRDELLLDLRSVPPEEDAKIAAALRETMELSPAPAKPQAARNHLHG
ncbi:MAG: L-seryl-tRNA(Sec) selenium transferase, partial [Planctomycetales bacterium]